MIKRKPVRAEEEPELAQTADEALFHAPEQVDDAWFCRWDEEDWPCAFVRDSQAELEKRVAEGGGR